MAYLKPRSTSNDKIFSLLNVNGGEQDALAKTLNAESFPTFIIYKKGKEIWRKQGIVSKEELLSQLK